MTSELYRAALHGVGRHLRKFGAVVYERRTKRLFNGVLIRQEGRHFLGTAAHCVNDLERLKDFDEVHIMTANRRLAATPTPPTSATYFLSSVHYDVGLLELSNELAHSLRAEWIDRSAASSEEALAGRMVCCIGASGRRVSSTQVLGPEATELQPDLVVAPITTRDPSGLSDYDRDVDLLVEWPEKCTDREGRPVAPHETFEGMSGCAVFLLPAMHPGRVWSPSETELIGIFTSQYRRRRLWKFQRVELLLEGIRHHVNTT